jgi:hypothetical protein
MPLTYQIQKLHNLILSVLVAHTGFEPVISALRGRRPKPLDECATASDYLRIFPMNLNPKCFLNGHHTPLSIIASGRWKVKLANRLNFLLYHVYY